MKTPEFSRLYTGYKNNIDRDISKYCDSLLTTAVEQFGDYPAEAVKAYCSILSRGGKRIRGVLTMNSYYMFGGKDNNVAIQAARAIEMLHAYILMADDVQDRSELRRGGPTAHVMLGDYHKKKRFRGDSQHFGVSLAINGFLFGAHSAINVIAELPLEDSVKLTAIKNINQNFITTAHGQSMDIFNEVGEGVTEQEVEKTIHWKTAYYSFLNPLQLGAILAGATEADLKKLEEYSFSAGRVFQITDDILGIFGNEPELGKSPMDDIKEGKQNILTLRAPELASKSDTEFLSSMLGNKDLSDKEFSKCREIIKNCGALDYAKAQIKISTKKALLSLDGVAEKWGSKETEFLKNLVNYMHNRKT